MNEIEVTIRGNVATEPRTVTFDDGNKVTSFRLASNARRYDVGQRAWVDGGTTYLQVNCRRALSENASRSLMVGEPILVHGRLKERSWEKDGRTGWTMEVDAVGLGHDLAWGTSHFARVNRVHSVTSAEEAGVAMAAAVAADARRIEAERRYDEVPAGVDASTGEILDGYEEEMDGEARELAAAV